MTNRYFVKDLTFFNSLSGYKYTNNTNVVVEWYGIPPTIIVDDWDQISALNQGLITTAMTTNGYAFDHDV